MMYDFILKAKAIYTMDDERPETEWVAVKNGKIAKLGSGEIPAGEEVVDFEDSVAVPGLIDSHVHGLATAALINAVSLLECKTIEQVLALIDERCRTTDDEIVRAMGFISWEVEGNRFPTMKELDSVSHGKMVYVGSITGHTAAINTAAYEAIDFSDFDFGLDKDENGEFNGYLSVDATTFHANTALSARMSDEDLEVLIDLFGQLAASNGLTTCHCLEGQNLADERDLDAWQRKIAEGKLPFHAVVYPQVWNYEEAKERWDFPRHGGCLTLDGADADFTMAMEEPYTANPATRGFLFHKDDEVYSVVSKAYADGKQTAFHAMGDRAIDQIMYIYDQVIKEQGQKDLRLRIEHFTFPTPQHMKMAAELGIVVAQQPEYPYLYNDGCITVFGEERTNQRMEMYRNELDAGIHIAGGSDAPINSLNPLPGLHGYVNTDNPGRKLTVTEAIKAYTTWGAYAAFEENERGMIKEGFYADFTLLSDDPYEKPDKINEFSIKGTISEGRLVFDQR